MRGKSNELTFSLLTSTYPRCAQLLVSMSITTDVSKQQIEPENLSKTLKKYMRHFAASNERSYRQNSDHMMLDTA